jgi:hypothetical protein
MAYPLGRRLGGRALLPTQCFHGDSYLEIPMAMAGWVATDGMAALSPSAAFRSAAKHFATHIASAEIRLWLSAAAAAVSAAAAAAAMLWEMLWATKGNRELGKGRKGGEAAAAALCHLALLT